jgi:YHS domain-containing protein
MFQKTVIYTLSFFLLSFGGSVSVGAFFGEKSQINTTWGGVALKGYDTVAYFTEGKPVKGKEEFEYEWKGAKWRFANDRHLQMFKADPLAYAPQYGGY